MACIARIATNLFSDYMWNKFSVSVAGHQGRCTMDFMYDTMLVLERLKTPESGGPLSHGLYVHI